MQHEILTTELLRYITDEILDGSAIDLDETTPLLQWGLLNSLGIIRLVSFIEERFSFSFPDELIAGQNFRSVAALADSILMLNDNVVSNA